MPGIAGWARRKGEPSAPPPLAPMLSSLSRPWYKVVQYHDTAGTVAIGCAEIGIVDNGTRTYTTPDGAVTVCMHGHIYAHPATSLTILELIAKCYQAQGVSFADKLQGEFFLVVADHANGRVTLLNDRYGRRHVYFAIHDGQILFASELKALLASGAIDPDVDEEALADFLAFAFIPGERTLLRQVSMLPPASALQFDLLSGTHSLSRYWDLRQHLQTSTEPEARFLDRVSEIFSSAVNRRLSPTHTTWLSLSAGMDSRTIASALKDASAPFKTVTSGVQGGYERKVTARIAQIIGAEHFFYEFDESKLTQAESELKELTREAIALTDGMRGTAFSAMTAFSARLRRQHGLESVLTGHGGEIAKLDEAYSLAIGGADDLAAIRHDAAGWTFRRLRRPNAPVLNTPTLYRGSIARVFEDAPRNHIQAIVDKIGPGIEPEQLVSFMFINELYRKRASYALAVQRAYVDIHVPFYDDEFLGAVVGAPLSTRSKYRIHRHIIQQHCPKLLDVVLSETRMRPFPSPMERIFRGLPYAVAKRVGLFKRDVPEQYFAANANIDFFRNILQDPMTVDRGYFNPDEVAKLLDAQSQGRKGANTLLHLLTIVELWHRDYVDTA